MVVCVNRNGNEHKFYTDDKKRFVELSGENKESVLLNDVSSEYDGVCTPEGNFHFLIQSMQGELIYLKLENKVWKKYSIFKNKDNECKIKNIKLNFSDSFLCAFYTIEHLGKIMLVKHVFSATNLYITPEIADLTDSKRDFCICTDPKDFTHLFYRDASGRRREIVYDKGFSKISYNQRSSGGDIYNLCAVNSTNRIDSAYMSVKKSYTALMYCGEDERKEKIITFGISKNTKPSLYANGDEIVVYWKENHNMMKSESKDGGEIFSKPMLVGKGTELMRYRGCGMKAGVIWSDYSLEKRGKKYLENKKAETIDTGRNIMTNRYAGDFTDTSSKELIFRLGKIQTEVEKIGVGLERVCGFLDKLTDLKKESEKEISLLNDIGEKNEENIRLFESMTIDEALPENNEVQIAFEE